MQSHFFDKILIFVLKFMLKRLTIIISFSKVAEVNAMKVLLTGCGFIGRNIAYALSDNNIEAVILDNAGDIENYSLPGCYFYKCDITNLKAVSEILEEHKDINVVIHSAMVSAVAQSVKHPLEFYSQNVVGSLKFVHLLMDRGIKKMIFASSASVYDDVPGFMVTERSPLKPRSPFGRSKYIFEMIMRDFCNAYDMKCISLRYFNPVGIDHYFNQREYSLPMKTGSNLLEILIKILNNEEKTFVINGDDWITRDGTCIRDYIHITDLAMANVKAVLNFDEAFVRAGSEYTNYLSINVGSGVDVTVREFLIAFRNITGEKINTVIGPRRIGDIGGSYANIQLAKKTIDWAPQFRVEDAIIDRCALND